MTNPRFSVIIPAYNAAEYIARGLNSIEQQTFRDFELIVVCDSCTDETASIARNYTDRVLTVDFHLDGLTRNAGIDAARGEYLLFMDDDDWWMHREAFRQISDALDANPGTDVLCFGFYWKNVGNCFQNQHRKFYAVWNKAWRREFVAGTRFPDRPYWSDVDFFNAMFNKQPRTSYLNEVLYYYNYLRPGSISWRKERGEIE